jgi:hypothetical protein
MEIVTAFRQKRADIISIALQHREALEATGLDIDGFLRLIPSEELPRECKDTEMFHEYVQGLMEFGEYIQFLKDRTPENAEQLMTWIINSGDSVKLCAKLGV